MADDPTRGDAPEAGLLEAIEAAARHVGSGREEADTGVESDVATGRTVVRFDAPLPRRLRLWMLTGVLLISSAGSAYLAFRRQEGPPPAVVEADLRWAVAQVVRRVEALRVQTGRLPAPADLGGLVSELVVYEPLGEGYWVYGQRGPVRVEFDGAIPLARWERMVLYGADTAP